MTPSMSVFVALLRAVNVGGTGKLAMRELVAQCQAMGLTRVRTYIQSGNVVFESDDSEAELKAKLEPAVSQLVGKPTAVLVRRRDELGAVLAKNPFPAAPPGRVIVLFLDRAPEPELVVAVRAPGGEELALRGRELYVHYPAGQGSSRLKLPLAELGTGRNLNTLAKLLQLAEASGG